MQLQTGVSEAIATVFVIQACNNTIVAVHGDGTMVMVGYLG